MRPRPTPEQLAHVVAQLTRYIPSPPTPKPVAQASKWGRKVGDGLTRQIAPGLLDVQMWTVTATDSLGLTLQGVQSGEVIRVESRSELTAYTKVRTRRRTKVAPAGA